MQAIQGVNENKAVMGVLKPQLIRLGNGRTEEIIYRILEQLWYERNDHDITVLNQSETILLYKNGDRNAPQNYRPISLRHLILNIMDRWIQLKLNEHLSELEIYQRQQYGFTPGRSTAEQIVNLQLTLEIM